MNSYMLLQTNCSPERIAASFAVIYSLNWMNSFMGFHLSLVMKTHWTNHTFMLFFTMNFFMLYEIRFTTEFFWTSLALMRFFSCVNIFMFSESMSSWEYFSTSFCTGKIFCFCAELFTGFSLQVFYLIWLCDICSFPTTSR